MTPLLVLLGLIHKNLEFRRLELMLAYCMVAVGCNGLLVLLSTHPLVLLLLASASVILGIANLSLITCSSGSNPIQLNIKPQWKETTSKPPTSSLQC